MTIRHPMLLLLAAFGLALMSATDARAAAACQPPGTPSYRDDQVVVWTQDAPEEHVLFIGCEVATGRTFTALDFDNSCISASGGCEDVYPRVRRVRRAGRWLALVVESQIFGRVALADVRAGTTPRAVGYRAEELPRELVLGRDGALAWITQYRARTRALRLCDARCRTTGKAARTIARGRKLRKLRIAGRRISWSDGERGHSAPVR
jgi:hypothetical protein